MNLTKLTFRLKGQKEVQEKVFVNFDEAITYLIENNLQKVVGKLEGIENPGVIYERAAANSKADWFEFSHVEV